MNQYGIQFEVKNKPSLDPEFMPILKFNRAFLETAKKPVSIALERSGGQVAVCDTFIHGTPEMRQADQYYIDRLVKSMLWMKGGFKVYVSGGEDIYSYLKKTFAPGGARSFDSDFMAGVYERPFEVVFCDKVPQEAGASQAVGRHLAGCRVGFDAGGSDRKVSAVIDGEPVYSEEVVWFPKITEDPDYHYDGIVSAFKSAAEKMPRVDAVGVSSAGIYIDNRTMVASLFLKVPKDKFNEKVKDIYIRAARDVFGPDIPLVVCNDGDVSALAGAMGLGENNVLGIAMGTSEAVGYVDEKGNITGWLNELAFRAGGRERPTPWRTSGRGDIGCGVKYFSQDARHQAGAPRRASTWTESLSPAEKLKVVQKLMDQDGNDAAEIYALHRHLSGPRPGILLRPVSLQARAAPGPGHVRQGRRPQFWRRPSGCWPTSILSAPASSSPPCPTRNPAAWASLWPPPACRRCKRP